MALTFINNIAASISGLAFLSNPYVAAVFILVSTGILAWLLLLFFGKVLETFASKTATDIDDELFAKTKYPLFYLILVQGLRLSLVHLQVGDVGTKIVNSLTAIVVAFLLARSVDVILFAWGRVVSKRTSSKLDDVLLPLLHKIAGVVFTIIAVLWIMKVWEIDITPYLAGAGIAGLVLGMALQDSLRNVFGGISLLIDGAIRIGDKIRLDSGEVGEVVDISLRSTKLRTNDNEMITVPNGYLANSRVQNYTKPSSKSRVYVDFGVGYGTKTEDVESAVLPVLNALEGIMDDPAPEVHFVSMGDSALIYKAYFWVARWQDSYPRKLDATKAIYDALTQKKIDIPYPTQTIHLVKE